MTQIARKRHPWSENGSSRFSLRICLCPRLPARGSAEHAVRARTDNRPNCPSDPQARIKYIDLIKNLTKFGRTGPDF
jgi:hypothetical protein